MVGKAWVEGGYGATVVVAGVWVVGNGWLWLGCGCRVVVVVLVGRVVGY